jgi:hypothetical protein
VSYICDTSEIFERDNLFKRKLSDNSVEDAGSSSEPQG